MEQTSEKLTMTCAEAASYLGCSYQLLHTQAVKKPEALGFPVCVIGNRVYIPRAPFIKFIKGE